MTKELKLTEGKDYYFNGDGLMVFTREYHLRRGFCCKSGCTHCPFGIESSNPEVPQELSDRWSSNPEEIEIYDGEIDEEFL